MLPTCLSLLGDLELWLLWSCGCNGRSNVNFDVKQVAQHQTSLPFDDVTLKAPLILVLIFWTLGLMHSSHWTSWLFDPRRPHQFVISCLVDVYFVASVCLMNSLVLLTGVTSSRTGLLLLQWFFISWSSSFGNQRSLDLPWVRTCWLGGRLGWSALHSPLCFEFWHQ